MDKIYRIIPMAVMAGLLAAAVSSCYKEDPLTPDNEAPKYTIVDSEDPAQHYLYEFWQNTGVYILSEYDDVDYMWNVNSTSDYEITRIEPTVLSDAIEYLKDVLTEMYGAEFAKKYFPFKILLAGQISDSMSYAEDADDMICGFGRSYIAIGKLRQDILSALTDTQKLEYLGKINGILWGNFIYENNLITIPESFFTPSQEYYGVNLKVRITNPDTYETTFEDVFGNPFNEEEAIKLAGMWFYSEPPDEYYAMAPEEAGDVAGFVEMILTHTAEEMQAEMEGYDILLIKYNALISAVKEACGIDLQALGNANVAKFGSLVAGDGAGDDQTEGSGDVQTGEGATE